MRPRPRSGFSALEWGLVALIICILMAWLASIGRVGCGRAEDSSCASNTKQLGMAMLMYATDYDGFFPSAAAHLAGLWPFVQNSQIFQCPAKHEEQEESGERCDYLFHLGASSDWLPAQYLVIDDSAFRHTFGTWIGCRLDGAVTQRPSFEYCNVPVWAWAKPPHIQPQGPRWEPVGRTPVFPPGIPPLAGPPGMKSPAPPSAVPLPPPMPGKTPHGAGSSLSATPSGGQQKAKSAAQPQPSAPPQAR